MKKVKIEYVNDDWIRLYVDGQLRAEGHSLSPYHVLKALGVDFEETEIKEEC